MACSAKRRPAEWKASRCFELQNRCGEPALRGSKAVSHQRHAGLIAAAVAIPAPPSIMYSPNLLARPSAPPPALRSRADAFYPNSDTSSPKLAAIDLRRGYARNLWPLQG